MDRRLQYTIALLFLFIHFTVAADDDEDLSKLNLTINYIDPPDECSYKKLTPDRFVAINAPLTAPGISTGSYESIIVSSPGQKITRDVIIYWENFLSCQGVIQFHYKAFYLIKTNTRKLTKVYADIVYKNYAIFTGLHYDVAYEFEVISINKLGASDVSLIHVPSDIDKTKPSKPKWLRNRQIMEDVYSLQWENPHNQLATRFHRSNQYTIHWCENEPNSMAQCNGKMYTMKVPITQSRSIIKVEHQTKTYQFAISAEMVAGGNVTTSVGSGLQWEECTLLRNTRREVIIIKKIWVTVIDSTYIGLRWKIDCSSMSDYFTAYQIYYCPVISTEKLKCQDKLTLKFLGRFPPNNMLPHAIIPNLKPDTLYMFSVEILTRVNNQVGVMFRSVVHFQRTNTK